MSDLVIDGITNREFSVRELTSIMNIVPNMYDFITALNIFGASRPLSTTYLEIEMMNWTLNLLPITERGAAGSKGSVGKRKKKLIEIPQITHEDTVKVSDVQNLLAYGSMAPMMLEDLIRQKLVTMAHKHQLTHEWFRINALQGKILDSDGSVALDFFTEFGVTQKVAAFGGVTGEALTAKLRAIKRSIEDDLLGDVMTDVIAIASPEFMEMLFADAGVVAQYKAQEANWAALKIANPQLHDRRFGFELQGITFYEYRGKASVLDPVTGLATTRRFIPAGDAIFFPMGTRETFEFVVAPGDFEEAHNLPGMLYYAKESRDKWGRARDLLTQSNPLPICKRPKLLIRGTTSNQGNNIN